MSRVYGALQSVLVCGFAVAYFLSPDRPLFQSPPARFVGGLLWLVGIGLIVAALTVIRHSIQIAPAPRADAQLVTHGVYAWFRHPIYTGIVFTVVGLFLRRPSLSIALATLVVIAYLGAKVRLEERLLRRRYPEYNRYAKRTVGLLPAQLPTAALRHTYSHQQSVRRYGWVDS